MRSARGSKEKRVVSRSAQKYNPVGVEREQCQECVLLKRRNEELEKEMGEMRQEVQNASMVQA